MAVNYFTAGLMSGLGQGLQQGMQYEMMKKLADRAAQRQLYVNEEARKAAARLPYEEQGITPPANLAESPMPSDAGAARRGFEHVAQWVTGKARENSTLGPIMEKIMPVKEPVAPDPASLGSASWEQLNAAEIAQAVAKQKALIPGQIELAKAGRNQQFIGVNPTQQAEWARQDQEKRQAEYSAAYVGFAKTAMNQDLTVDERMKKLAQDRLDTLRANPGAAASIDAAYGAAVSAAQDPTYAYKPGILSNIFSSLTGDSGGKPAASMGPALGPGEAPPMSTSLNPDVYRDILDKFYGDKIYPDKTGDPAVDQIIDWHNDEVMGRRKKAQEPAVTAPVFGGDITGIK